MAPTAAECFFMLWIQETNKKLERDKGGDVPSASARRFSLLVATRLVGSRASGTHAPRCKGAACPESSLERTSKVDCLHEPGSRSEAGGRAGRGHKGLSAGLSATDGARVKNRTIRQGKTQNFNKSHPLKEKAGLVVK